MADEPPRPKPGSLKDRIKQFEQSSTSSSSAPAPPPLRPKVGALGQWKPKAIDPPSPTKATSSTSDSGATGDEHASAGLSAADAASSIRTGGSLKERMAALQGKGAFGSSAATAAPPLPSSEGKPRVWRTSPVPPIEPKAEGESGEKQEGTEEAQEPSVTSPISPGTEQSPGVEGGEGEGEPKTEEEEERERRAAIAARMARLGGARVGMPVGFGVVSKGLHNKPAPPVKPKILTPGGGDTSSAATSPLPISPSAGETEEGEESARKTTLDTALAIPLPKSQGSLLSSGGLDIPSDSDATISGKLVPPRSPSIPKSPDTMPIPALPKRAAGPRRKKSGKDLKPSSSTESGTTPPVPAEQAQSPPTIETEQAKDVEYFSEEKTAEPVPVEQKEEVKEESPDELASVPPSDTATLPPPSPSVGVTEDESNEDSDVAPVSTKRPTLDISTTEDDGEIAEYRNDTLTPKPKEDEDAEETEEERAARKKRVAEKMAQLGGVNPFSPGGFVSPASPSGRHVEEPESAQETTKEAEDINEEEGSKHEEDVHEGEDKDVTESAHESKTVPVLSSSDDLQDHDRSAIVSTSIEHASTQERYTSPNQSAKAIRVEERNQDPVLVDDDEVDYPMMSPSGDSRDVSFSAAHGSDVEVAPRGSGEVERSPMHDEEEILSHEERESTPIQESAVPQELENDYEPEASVTHENKDYIDQQEDEEDMRPPRITRAVPPPPSRRPPSVESSPASSARNSPRNSQFADINETSPPRAQLVAALARRAPVPPPHRSSSSSSSVSPPSSPPFEREGAPSPPSLRSLSNIEDGDEEEYEEEDSGVLGSDGASGAVLNEEARSSSPAPMRGPPINRSGNASPAPANRSPPPVPSSRPPIPALRRSIPPPPPESPPPRSRPASGRASPAPAHGRQASSGDAAEGTTIRKAATRPAVPPPRWDEFESSQSREREVMDDEETDPVDPVFVGSRRPSQPSGTSPPPLAPRPTLRSGSLGPQRQASLKPEVSEDSTEVSQTTEQEEDPESARRRTIAERMAKLGGIKFGMAPPTRPPPIRRTTEPKDEADESKPSEAGDARAEIAQDPDSEQTPEEAERSRRAGIAARMAAMGGRGFGMYGAGAVPAAPAIVHHTPPPSAPVAASRAPLAAPPPIPNSRPRVTTKDDAVKEAASRAPPPLRPSATKSGETSESEIELVNAEEEEGEMIEEEEDEEPELVDTPQLPSRAARPSAHHASRPPPPIPGQSDSLLSEEGEATPPLPAARRPPPTRAAPPPVSPPNEYVDVGEEISAAVPRRTHSRPPPTAHSESVMPPSLDSSGQWELPNIPSGSFDLSGYSAGKQALRPVEQDQSWTKVEQEDQPSTSTMTTSEPFTGPSPAPLPADRLAALARTLGPKVLQSCQHVYEKSKRLVIGDGSSVSFLLIVLGPTGASTNSLGHLVYAQNGANVQKRLGDIMPGDVIALYEAHFKGHKGGLGLGGYSASWGTKEEPVLGVVSDFDGKKSKIRAYTVNQHPNAYPTIDNPSFKLDDLKSGLVKVFRVAEDSR